MMTNGETLDEHLAIATEYIRQLQAERHDIARIIAETFADCYASSYLRGDEVAKIIVRRFGGVK